ncbi:sodium:calcium antiporter [Acuticoccus sp.]|uniref:sodium:calcium antiporter n=1 Tax=Acuticoccus sp. TaxID=1904378 RepID=UPI003B519A68
MPSQVVILLAGARLARLADVLADRTGLGEAVAVLLGATTSASGAINSITAAATGDVDLAYSNALGGIAAQTAFLAVADCVWRRANLEHAAAEAANLTQATTLMVLLTIPLLAGLLPEVTVIGIHPASLVLVLVYVAGVAMARQDRKQPMWLPRRTSLTREDKPEAESEAAGSLVRLAASFGALVLLVGVAGYAIAVTGASIAAATGLSSTVVGALLTATATSLPELVTTLAAVRRGALQLAVGGIIGGNMFDVLFLSLSDTAYRDGSIYNAIGPGSQYWALVGILMTGVLLLGLIRRQRTGFANIGLESVLLLALWISSGVVAFVAFGA